jgi:hypothetical protein
MSGSLRCRSHWEERHCGWHAGTKLPTWCGSGSSRGLYQAFRLGGWRSVVPSCTRSSRGIVARPVSVDAVSNLVSIWGPVRS